MLEESNAIEREYDQDSLDQAFEAFEYLMSFDKITPNAIKETHAILMKNHHIEPKYKGDWRDVPVWIGGERKSQPKIVIQSLIEDLCDTINSLVKSKNINSDPVTYHIQFENIHPFIDGNGRMGRMILNWHLLNLGAPLLVYTEKDKHTYYMLFPSYRQMTMDKLWGGLLKEWKKEIHEKQSNNNSASEQSDILR